MISSPTGLGVRVDPMGNGHFGSPRDGGTRSHAGLDFKCEPGGAVMSPIDGIMVRAARPYKDGPYSGAVIENRYITVKMFYFLPDMDLIGKPIRAGDVIGTAQDISRKYGRKMTPHIHLQIDKIDPEVLLDA